MGRETKILLALLATLGGVFLGVLSMKLLVPRPPIGAGPDVHVEASSTPIELVEPPTLSSTPPAVAATGAAAYDGGMLETPPRVAETRPVAETEDLLPRATQPSASHTMPAAPAVQQASIAAHDGLPASAPLTDTIPTAPPLRDPFVKPATHQEPAPETTADRGSPAGPMPAAAAAYVANPGDSWWDLAERAYGDGRLYRALFAWNRVIDPRVSLTPGTRLEIPSRERLEAAWPKLMPAK